MNWFVWFPVVFILTSHPSEVCVWVTAESCFRPLTHLLLVAGFYVVFQLNHLQNVLF